MIKKVSSEHIPSDEFKKLKELSNEQKQFIYVGSNFYEIRPLPAIKLMKLVTIFTEEMDRLKHQEAKRQGIENQEEIDKINVPDEVLFSSDKILTELRDTILSGVDEEDYENMSMGQFGDIISKVMMVNFNIIPQNIKDNYQDDSSQEKKEVEDNSKKN